MPFDVNDSVVSSHVPCGSCGCDLLGLSSEAICPECSHPIQSSVEHFLARHPTLPLWLSLCRTAYMTSFGVLAASCLLLPVAAQFVGAQHNERGAMGSFLQLLHQCFVVVGCAGGLLVLLLAVRKDPTASSVFVVLLLNGAGILILPAL